eukprot:TRINITY_DN9891_c3_g1_i2.p1 TRINITY_DN9891_c3_g1~~TRINITY_DN9891_c3_g1_i2.p1  ORF type:complete len:1114 (+),score=194.93 TRINITY_DN9891_c3_g1_i2:178-3519(+)
MVIKLSNEEAEEKIALVSPMLQRVVELSGCGNVKGLIVFLQEWEELTQQALNCTRQSSGRSIGRRASHHPEQRTRFSHFTTEIEDDGSGSNTSSPTSPEMEIERRRSSLQLELSMNKPLMRTRTGIVASPKPDLAQLSRRRASLPARSLSMGDALQFKGKAVVCCSPNLRVIPNEIDAASLLQLPSVPPPPPPQDCNLSSPLMMITSKLSSSAHSPIDAQSKYVVSPTLSVLDLLDRPKHDRSPQDGFSRRGSVAQHDGFSRRGSVAQHHRGRRLSSDTAMFGSGFNSRKHSQHSETMTHKSSYRKKNVFSNAALRARLSMMPDDLGSVHRTMSEDITETNDGIQTSDGDLLGSVDMQYDGEDEPKVVPKTEEQQTEDMTKAAFERFDVYWKPILFLYSLYQLIMIPSRIGLDSNPSWASSIIDLAVDFIWCFEIFCSFYRPFERQGLYVTKKSDIWQNYLKGNFMFDLLIAVPFEVVGFGLYSRNGTHTSAWRKETAIISPFWRINKVLLVRYSDDMFSSAFKSLYNGHPLVTRSVRTIWSFTLITHYFACGLLVLLFHEGKETGVHFTRMEEMYDFGEITTQYFLAYDYSLKAMVGMGRPGRTMPQTDLQAIFCLITAFAGVALYATVLATIANLVSDEVSESEKWRNKINKITDVLQYINKARDPLPRSLTTAIRGYYHHTFWISRVLLGRMDEVIPDLPVKISIQVQQVVGGETMARVPMFKAASADSQFLHYMLYNLEPVTFCEHEIVMEKGDKGDGMYFLLAGAMGVLSDKTGEVVFVLHRGSFLGEIALIHDCRRTATVKALTCCSAFRLSKTVFKEAAALFPKAIARVEAEAGDRLQKIKLEEIVKKVPLFAALDDDPDFIREVVGALEPKVHPPGTEVVVKGEIGTEMFFVAQGELSVRVDGKTVHTMKEGSFFGEIVMLFDTRRTASIFAETYVDLFTLSKKQFQSVMDCYPAQAAQIAETGRERFRAFLVEDLLKKIHLFSSLKTEIDFLDRLAQALCPRPMEEDQMLITAGDMVSEVFFISTGEVTVINEDDCVSAILTTGDHFGGISMLRDYTSLTTLYCRASGEIYCLTRSAFNELAEEFPDQCAILRDFALGQLKKMV